MVKSKRILERYEEDCKRQRMEALDTEAILYDVLEHIVDKDFVYLRRLLSMVSKRFRDRIAELSKLTELQKCLLARLMCPNSMESIPDYPSKIQPEHRIRVPAASGATRTMLLAALKLSLQHKKPVGVVTNSELFMKATKTMEKLVSEFNLPPAQILQRSELRCLQRKEERPVIFLLSIKNLVSPLFFELCRTDVCAIFVDEFAGKQYPKFSREMKIWWKMKQLPMPGFAILDSRDTQIVDKQIQLPKLRPILHLVKSCAFCLYTDDCHERTWYEMNLAMASFLVDHLKDKKKILILHQLSRELEMEVRQISYGAYFEALVREAKLPPLLHYGSHVETNVATFNAWETATLALPWNSRSLAGHDILADAVVLFNGRSPHAGRHPVTPSPRAVADILHCIRRPTNKNAEIPVCIVDFNTTMTDCIELLLAGKTIAETTKCLAVQKTK